MEDIAPALYEKIEKDFDSLVSQDKKIQDILARVNNGTATAEDIQLYSIRIGDHAAEALSKNIITDVLPDGKMYYNIAMRTVVPQLMKNYELVEGVAEEIQKLLNTAAGIGLNPVHVDVNQDRINGFVNKMTAADAFDDVSHMLNEPVKNFTQNVADEFAHQNAAFQAKAGLSPKIKREVYGSCCDWCQSLAGSYAYGKEPRDFYRKHAYCRCLITYDPGNGKVQNAHTKEWFQSERDARIDHIENQSGASSGAKRTEGWEDRHADQYYEEVRNREKYSDAIKIANNVTGFTVEEIEDIRQHMFIRDIPRDGGLKRFDSDYMQAEAWQRLVEGKNIRPSDIVLLQHELFELRYMEETGCVYETAHERANILYNWVQALKKEK